MMAQLPNEVYLHLDFDEEKFKAQLRDAIKSAIVEVLDHLDRCLKIEEEANGK